MKSPFVVVCIIMVLCCVIGLSSYLPSHFSNLDKVQMSDFPKTVGSWTSQDIPLTERDYAILETRNLIMRRYQHPELGSLYLYIVYSDDNRKVAHPPEVCYLGSGATITDKAVIKVTPGISANRMLTDTNGKRQYVIYWFRALDSNIADYGAQQIKIILRRLVGLSTSSAMIRVSVDILDDAAVTPEKITQDFSAGIEPLLTRYVP